MIVSSSTFYVYVRIRGQVYAATTPLGVDLAYSLVHLQHPDRSAGSHSKAMTRRSFNAIYLRYSRRVGTVGTLVRYWALRQADSRRSLQRPVEEGDSAQEDLWSSLQQNMQCPVIVL